MQSHVCLSCSVFDRQNRIHVLLVEHCSRGSSIYPLLFWAGLYPERKIRDLNPGFLVEGFLWEGFPALVEKKKRTKLPCESLTFLCLRDSRPKSTFPTACTEPCIASQLSVFLGLGFGPAMSAKERRCNSGGGMNEGRKGPLTQGKSRQDVKLAAFLFMSRLKVESSGTDTANLYE